MTKKPDILRIAVAQLNPTVGDVAGNLAKAREARADAARQGADLVLYTELFLAGYPPEDLVLKPAFLKSCERAAEEFAKDTADGGPGVIIGTPLKRKSGTHNSIIVADGGKILAERYKLDLPNYGEFDEKRVFQAGPELQGRSTSAACASESRSARTSGARSLSARRWPKAEPKSCWCRTARPTIAPRWTSGTRSSSARS
ncbi:hypothetical protein AJ88_33850 [Mesorhizobium amorphae CCBAU 01583]|nr:hypothetical protein AJ88_33850 [Mesorhizobium amorphae CCBAU 01583]